MITTLDVHLGIGFLLSLSLSLSLTASKQTLRKQKSDLEALTSQLAELESLLTKKVCGSI